MVIFNKDNPLSVMVDIFNENFCVDMQGREIEVEICFSSGMDFKGCTWFDDDGKPYLVDIEVNQTMVQILDVLAHELAHVVTGCYDDEHYHSQEWQIVYDTLHDLYNDKANELYEEVRAVEV